MLIGQVKQIQQQKIDISNILFTELPIDLQIVADKCGIDTVLLLLNNLQGTNIYVPKVSKLTAYVMRYINENPDKSIKELAIGLGVSETYIRKMQYGILLDK